MKYYVLIIAALLGLGELQAQVAEKDLAISPSTNPTMEEEVSPTLLPVKKVILLQEIQDLEAFEAIDKEPTDDLLPPANVDGLTFDLKVMLHLFSTAQLNKIHLKVGTAAGGSDIGQHIFSFDAPSN